MFVYETTPIDHFVGAMSIDEYFAALKDEAEMIGNCDASYDIAQATSFLMDAARHALGWEGDLSRDVFVSPLPNPDTACCEPLFMWKQSNNGTTFVASPFELPWMADCEVYRK